MMSIAHMNQTKTNPGGVPLQVRIEDDRTGLHPRTLKRAFLDHLLYSEGHTLDMSTVRDAFEGLAFVVRDRLMRRWIRTQRAYYRQNVKRLYYLSAEFLRDHQVKLGAAGTPAPA